MLIQDPMAILLFFIEFLYESDFSFGAEIKGDVALENTSWIESKNIIAPELLSEATDMIMEQ